MADRNHSPHAEAVAAMYIWSVDYAAQNGGVMDFWDSLSASRRERARDLVDRVISLPRVMPPQKNAGQ